MIAAAKLVTVVAGLGLSTWGALAFGAGRAAQCLLVDVIAHLPH